MASRKKTLRRAKEKPRPVLPVGVGARRPTVGGAPRASQARPDKPERHNDAHTDKATTIRRAAFQCFAEGGFHETTVDDICQKAGVSKGTFYWYFESKEQVFVQILELWADEAESEVLAQFRAAFEAGDPVGALLAALGREGRRGRRQLPVWLDALVQSQRHPELQRALAHFMARVRRSLAKVLAPPFSSIYSPEEIETLAGLFFSCFIGAISQEMADPDRHIYDEQSRMLLVTVEQFARLQARAR